MNVADFRTQSSTPTAQVAGTVGLYANATSGIVLQTTAGRTWVGGQFTGIIANTAVVTGVNLLGFSGWLGFVGPSGQKWAVPAYTYV